MQCALKKFKMPGCDCKTCWEYRLRPGPKPCLPKPLCPEIPDSSRDVIDDVAETTPLAAPNSAPVSPTDKITTFLSSISSRVLASLLGRSSVPGVYEEDTPLQPWQRYAAATAMSEAPRPALMEELQRYSAYGHPYSNPVAQLERDQYEQKDLTTRDEPMTTAEVGGRAKGNRGKQAKGKQGKQGKRGKKATNQYGETPFLNDRVAQQPRSRVIGKSFPAQVIDAFRDVPSQYESEMMATEAAHRELERREAVANGELDPAHSECCVM